MPKPQRIGPKRQKPRLLVNVIANVDDFIARIVTVREVDDLVCHFREEQFASYKQPRVLSQGCIPRFGR